MIRTLSLSDLMEVEEEKNEEQREVENETNLLYNPHDTADPHLYLSDQLENEKVNPPSKKIVHAAIQSIQALACSSHRQIVIWIPI